MYFVDLGESFPTHIFFQNLASIQPRTSPVKFAEAIGGGDDAPAAPRAAAPPKAAKTAAKKAAESTELVF